MKKHTTQSSRLLPHNRKGQDTWEIIKWFPRIFMLLLIVLFCYYLFISFWSVDYDAKTARSASIHPKILYSMAIANGPQIDCVNTDNLREIIPCALAKPYFIDLEHISDIDESKMQNRRIDSLMYFYSEPQEDIIARKRTGPYSAEVFLEYQVNDNVEDVKFYINKNDYDFFIEQAGLQINRYGVTESITSVTVIDGDNKYPGILKIKVIVA